MKELKETVASKIADHAFEAVKFFIGLFFTSLTFFFAIFTAYWAFSSTEVGASALALQAGSFYSFKNFLQVLTALLGLHMWVTWYLVAIAGKRYQDAILVLSGGEDTIRSRSPSTKLIIVGTAACALGTVVLAFVFVLINGS